MKDLEELKMIKEVKEEYYKNIHKKNTLLKELEKELSKLNAQINLVCNRQKNSTSNEDNAVFRKTEQKLRIKRLSVSSKIKELKNG